MKKPPPPPYSIYQPPIPVTRGNPVDFLFFDYHRQPEALFDMHYLLEMGVVLEGRTRRIYKTHEAELAAGGLWFQGIWEGHGYQVVEAPCRLLVVMILPELLMFSNFPEAPELDWTAPFRVPPERRPLVLPGGAGRLRALEAELRALVTSDADRLPVRKHLALRSLLLEAMEGWTSGGSVSLEMGTDADVITRAVELVFSSRNFLSEQEVADSCKIHRNRFHRLFRKRMGLGFSDFALCHRLAGAAQELLTLRQPVEVVARAWGFVDHSHFLRTFRRHYGITPAVYRRTRLGIE